VGHSQSRRFVLDNHVGDVFVDEEEMLECVGFGGVMLRDSTVTRHQMDVVTVSHVT